MIHDRRCLEQSNASTYYCERAAMDTHLIDSFVMNASLFCSRSLFRCVFCLESPL